MYRNEKINKRPKQEFSSRFGDEHNGKGFRCSTPISQKDALPTPLNDQLYCSTCAHRKWLFHVVLMLAILELFSNSNFNAYQRIIRDGAIQSHFSVSFIFGCIRGLFGTIWMFWNYRFTHEIIKKKTMFINQDKIRNCEWTVNTDNCQAILNINSKNTLQNHFSSDSILFQIIRYWCWLMRSYDKATDRNKRTKFEWLDSLEMISQQHTYVCSVTWSYMHWHVCGFRILADRQTACAAD